MAEKSKRSITRDKTMVFTKTGDDDEEVLKPRRTKKINYKDMSDSEECVDLTKDSVNKSIQKQSKPSSKTSINANKLDKKKPGKLAY